VRTVVPFDADAVNSAMDRMADCALRQRRTACFLSNGQVGSTGSAHREKTMAVADLYNQVQIIEACHASACHRVEEDDARIRRFASNSPPVITPPSSMHTLRSISHADLVSSSPCRTADARFGTPAAEEPLMSLTVHPHLPFLLCGARQQRVRIVTHESELELDVDLNLAGNSAAAAATPAARVVEPPLSPL